MKRLVLFLCLIFLTPLWPHTGFVVSGAEFAEEKPPPQTEPNELEPAAQLIALIKANKVYAPQISEQELERARLTGIIQALDDPYVALIDTRNQNIDDSTTQTDSSEYGLIVAEDEYDRLFVQSVLPESPAARAGLMPGDRILRVGNENVAGHSAWEVLPLLSKPDNLRLVVQRPNRGQKEVVISEQPYEMQTVELRIGDVGPAWIEDNSGPIAWIKIHTFLSSTTIQEWNRVVERIHAHPEVQRVVLDLRNNGGGDNTCIRILGDFFRTGEDLVTFHSVLTTRPGRQRVRNYSLPRSRLITYPAVVLVNDRTASLAEITAAALRDNRSVPLVGETTYGKGTTQTWVQLGTHYAAHLTLGRWFTAGGYSIDGEGLIPDVCVKDDPNTPDDDEQLLAAVQVLFNGDY